MRPGPRPWPTTPSAEGLRLSESVAYADSTSDLPLLEAVGFPVAVNPETRLSALARKRGWLVEHFDKAPGAPSKLVAHRPPAAPIMKALVFERDVAGFAAARVAGAIVPGRGASHGPLRLRRTDPPEAPGEDWVAVRPRLSGICGSDLATIDGRASRYFEPIVSFPFVPGHEIVGDLDDGTRVVIESVLGCEARGISRSVPRLRRGDVAGCRNVAFGHLEPGLQTGFCEDTGGGWSTLLRAHPSQLRPVPDDLSDEAAVMIEPTACALRGAFAAVAAAPATVAVVGSGALGLFTIAALRYLDPDLTVLASARYPAQRRLAAELGADRVVAPDELLRAVRATTGSMRIGDQLTGGADAVVDCVGSAESIAQSLAVTRPRGTVVLTGMPGTVSARPHRPVAQGAAPGRGLRLRRRGRRPPHVRPRPRPRDRRRPRPARQRHLPPRPLPRGRRARGPGRAPGRGPHRLRPP